jgi:threonine/homoserine/homoserine lactone efflux protein
MFNWESYLPYVLIMAWTPGPNNITSMQNGMHRGFRRGLVYNFGILVGTFIISILGMAFSAVLYWLIPRISLPMKIIGAAYMVYLAISLFLHSKKGGIKRPANLVGTFTGGVILQFLNPKIILYSIVCASTYVLPVYKSIFILALFAALQAVNSCIATCGWSAVGSVFNSLYRKHALPFNIVMAALLAWCAVSLFL